jgi:hypothetical protein
LDIEAQSAAGAPPGNPDHLGDFIENAFHLEVVKCSLEEIEAFGDHPLSPRQQFSKEHAWAYLQDALEFAVGEGENWGLGVAAVRQGLKERWAEYVDVMTSRGGPELQTRRAFLEKWAQANSLGYVAPTWEEDN